MDDSEIHSSQMKDVDGEPESELSPKSFLNDVEETYRILPMFQHDLTHHKPTLNIKTNEYLSRQWNKFLDNPSPQYVEIRLFVDLEERVSLARRMSLNGKSFYNHQQKLVPVPDERKKKQILANTKKLNIVSKEDVMQKRCTSFD